jgi:hypothetical protein
MLDHGLGVAKDPAQCWAWIRWAHDECPPLPESETRVEHLDAEVGTAFRFFRAVLDADARARGDALFTQLLREREAS